MVALSQLIRRLIISVIIVLFCPAGFTALWGTLYLHPGLRQVDLQRHLLPHEDVRVSRLGEQRLQDVQLRARERGPLPPLLPRVPCRTQRAARYITTVRPYGPHKATDYHLLCTKLLLAEILNKITQIHILRILRIYIYIGLFVAYSLRMYLFSVITIIVKAIIYKWVNCVQCLFSNVRNHRDVVIF